MESIYIGWGEHVLPDVIASFVAGEAESLVELAFTEMIYDFPRMKTLADLTFLRQKVHRLETEQQTWFPQSRCEKRICQWEGTDFYSTACPFPLLESRPVGYRGCAKFVLMLSLRAPPFLPRLNPSLSSLPIWLYISSVDAEGIQTSMRGLKPTRARRVLQSKCCH